MIKICTATIEDAYEISRLEEECFSMPWSKRAVEESISQEHYIFLKAMEENRLVGYISMYKSFDEGDIVNLAVYEEHRRKGIASLLLKTLIERCINDGIARVLLDVRKSNEKAILLYKKYHFKEIAIRKNFYEKPVEDCIVMEAITTI